MDYKIASVEVDCKYFQTLNAWMILGKGVAQISERFWLVAKSNDPVVSAPDLPSI
jgi:hypothetical protein